MPYDRTYMFGSAGAAAFSIITLEIGATAIRADGTSNVDVGRVVQDIIGGIGCLGAGTIIQSGSGV